MALCFAEQNKFKRFIHSANIVDSLLSLTSRTSQTKKPKLHKILGGLYVNNIKKIKGTSIHSEDLFYWVDSDGEHRGLQWSWQSRGGTILLPKRQIKPKQPTFALLSPLGKSPFHHYAFKKPNNYFRTLEGQESIKLSIVRVP